MRLSPSSAIGLVAGPGFGSPTQQHALGTRVAFASYDYSATAGVPNAGGGEAVYVKAAGTFVQGRLVHVDKDWVLLDLPNTANTGRPALVALSTFSSTNIFGWAVSCGMTPVSYSAAATVGAVYFAAAGQATPTLTAGKQLLGATCLIAATGNFTRTVKPVNGSPWVTVNDVSGMYIGLTTSGTGISGTIAELGSDGRSYRSSANSTASNAVTGTFTHTGFGIVHLERPFVQGNIT